MNGKIKVGLMGFGTVGTGVVRLVDSYKEDFFNQTGSVIEVSRILVRNPEKERSVFVNSDIVTTDPRELIYDQEVEVIIEVMGGIEPARTYILEAIEQGKHIVTANKDLMAIHGEELIKKAREHGCDLFYEASVAGGIPIINAIVEGFSSDRITKIMGIVNGTTNYILTKMSHEQASFDEVLQEAQQLGYAEADPTSDVEGLDAARKMAILSSLGFHVGMNLEDVSVRGISKVTLEDIKYGEQLGYTMKLIGIAKKDDELIEVSVEPTFVKNTHPLANVNGVFNAVYVYGEAVGETMFYGPGAGELPTATAVLSDLVTVVKNIKLGVNGRNMATPYNVKKLKREEDIYAKYFIRLIVNDESGVLAQIAKLMAAEEISLEKVLQEPYPSNPKKAELILVTHQASKKCINNVLAAFENVDYIEKVKSCYRVEGGE
ncbi:Homoserine dehydrogenase [Caldibacillus thermoamylovorans]|jgi:homoserine dehydrogenase|uniref:Homoserine dehydrogenase n=1 Tax=Caldibacillus thermoamylovorans TaxID=35841 RepID=A0A090IYR6_9BACI|nr:homoserine dehydrogenase [Caldibacillus thermoamylovorans]MCB5935339.1 homoserine dehydrogenase [Bacillus sp. DFI.2.34]MCB7077282.1 homoserine dehydrogenase [Caldibacillus thermoamylovorans]MCM3054732.1 homoserine dehydrogenase [Caldibacillus thermoamylovorans]CEE02847.1 Homoserine dehydrogenase [Caldibacillus thermoamylovorans]